ncbi:MAG: hypothetical protein AAFQ53_14755, partial [Bacteroidota bacterium]
MPSPETLSKMLREDIIKSTKQILNLLSEQNILENLVSYLSRESKNSFEKSSILDIYSSLKIGYESFDANTIHMINSYGISKIFESDFWNN